MLKRITRSALAFRSTCSGIGRALLALGRFPRRIERRSSSAPGSIEVNATLADAQSLATTRDGLVQRVDLRPRLGLKAFSEARVDVGVRAPSQASIDLGLALWAAILENHPVLLREIMRSGLRAALEQPPEPER
jgi:hypothetical protein